MSTACATLTESFLQSCTSRINRFVLEAIVHGERVEPEGEKRDNPVANCCRSGRWTRGVVSSTGRSLDVGQPLQSRDKSR